ncbi:TRAP transporter substrate-binding protein DctP [Neobacillus sp. YX16]|uniref:TRAP transporter substrate-binding protein DctP n=1 Tax=Neobacillus sp. YX16 TaxID=3047874 RepID=UPI0024C2E9E4|nr:TRAP transporter substrate-binding protein DctP [Neobacillus sp. YX16]WHZ00873.1 TRAP transporter substrate-binding protein DctP [Neobacillus sp. YX16]
MKKVINVCIKIALFGLLIGVIAGCSSGSKPQSGETQSGGKSSDKVYTLKLSTAMDLSNPVMAGFPYFEEYLKEHGDGKIRIEYVGGPEAIPPFNQGEAIQNGTVDMAWLPTSYYAELVPEALVANFSELTYEEEIERGSIEYLSSLHEQALNAKLVGRSGMQKYTFYFTGDKKIESIANFKGLRIRGTGTYLPFVESLGADAISMAGEEIFSGLEKGIIDGFAYSDPSTETLGVTDLVTKKMYPVFNRTDNLILANLDTWNSLPEDIQTIITDATIHAYNEMQKDVEKLIQEENELLESKGAEIVELTDGEAYVQQALKASWKWLSERVSDPEQLAKYFRK